MRKFPSAVDFFVFELVVVEAHPGEMDDEVVGGFSQVTALCHVGLLLARVTLVVRYHLSCYVFLEGLLNRLVPLYLKGKRVKCFVPLVGSVTVRADC